MLCITPHQRTHIPMKIARFGLSAAAIRAHTHTPMPTHALTQAKQIAVQNTKIMRNF